MSQSLLFSTNSDRALAIADDAAISSTAQDLTRLDLTRIDDGVGFITGLFTDPKDPKGSELLFSTIEVPRQLEEIIHQIHFEYIDRPDIAEAKKEYRHTFSGEELMGWLGARDNPRAAVCNMMRLHQINFYMRNRTYTWRTAKLDSLSWVYQNDVKFSETLINIDRKPDQEKTRWADLLVYATYEYWMGSRPKTFTIRFRMGIDWWYEGSSVSAELSKAYVNWF